MAKPPKALQFMFQNQNGNKIKGITVIEILIAIFILLVAFVGILGLLTFSLQVSTLMKETAYANFLAQEALEAARNFRDGTSWNTDGLGTLAPGIAYHPEKIVDNPAKWQLIQGEELIDKFSRKTVFENVFRDGNDNITESGGTLDPETKKITVTVFWKDKKVEIISYLTNWQ